MEKGFAVDNKSNLQRIRESLGMTKAELSRLSDVSTKVISETEKGKRDPRPETKNKLVIGLNKKTGENSQKFTFHDIFPD